MTNNLIHHLSVGERHFIFDGASLAIYQTDGSAQAIAKTPSKTSSLDSNRGTYLRNIALNLTNSCNLACSYCYANQGKYDNPGADMSFETARKSVDLVIDSVVKHGGDTVTIGFFGGEPLLAFKLIERVVAYINSNVPDGIAPQYLITTNGTLLKSEHVELMKKNNFKVMLSLDGNAAAHDAGRTYPSGRGSYEDVIHGLAKLADAVQITARVTVTERNPCIDQAVSHVHSRDIKRITYALDYNLSDTGYHIFIQSLDRLFADYQSSIQRGDFFDITNVTEPLTAIVLKKKKRSHCNAGVSYVSVSAEGKIYRCPRFTGDERFALGTVERTGEKEIDVSISRFKSKLRNHAGERTTGCASCPFVNICGGVCYHHAASVEGAEFAAVPRECDYRQGLFHKTLELLCALTVSERRNFLLYLNRTWREEGR